MSLQLLALLLILVGSFPLFWVQKLGVSKNNETKIRIVGICITLTGSGVAIYVFMVTNANTWLVWKLAIFPVMAAIIILSWIFLTRKLIIRSPFVTQKQIEKEVASRAKLIQYECDVDLLSKTQLRRIDDLLSKTNNEIYFMGLTLETLRQVTPSFANALRNNRRIRVLLHRPRPGFDEMIERLVVTSNLGEGISRTTFSISSLNEVQPPLTTEPKE